MLTKTKIFKKNKKKHFLSKMKKKSVHMAQGKPQLKFERNPCIRFRENCATDGRMTDNLSPIP